MALRMGAQMLRLREFDRSLAHPFDWPDRARQKRRELTYR